MKSKNDILANVGLVALVIGLVTFLDGLFAATAGARNLLIGFGLLKFASQCIEKWDELKEKEDKAQPVKPENTNP